MKRTKSMIIAPSEEARELVLFTENTGELYKKMIVPTVRNLAKKYAKGMYNSDRAIDAYYAIATEASRMYNHDFGYTFTVTERFTAAAELEANYRENVEKNDI